MLQLRSCLILGVKPARGIKGLNPLVIAVNSPATMANTAKLPAGGTKSDQGAIHVTRLNH